MQTLENLIDVVNKKNDNDSEKVKKQKKENRKMYREQFNDLIDEKYKFEEQKEIFDINKAIKQKAVKKQKLTTKKVLGNLPATENAMYKNAKTKKEIRTQNRINKEKEINATHGINGLEVENNNNFYHRKNLDRMALGGNFKNIYIHNDMPDEMTHKVLADGTFKNILKDT